MLNIMLHKSLKSRHLTMIALGGSIGTGMFLTSGISINQAGPGGALLAYLIISILVFFLITSLGELSTYLPSTGSFCEYSSNYVNKPFGYAMSINYWLSWAVTIAAEVSAAVIITKFWFPNGSDLLMSFCFLLLILIFNVFSVRVFGEIEWLLSFIKISAIVFFLLCGFALIYKQPNFGIHNFFIEDAPFHNGLKGFIKIFLTVGFAFQGSELIGVNSGEAENPEKSIPSAVRNVFWRLFMFYILGTLVITLLIPFNKLAINGDIHSSPFVIVFNHYFANKIAVNVLNFIILVAVISAGNSSMYTASRILWYMSVSKYVPTIFSKTNRFGLPIYSIIVTTLFGSLVFFSSLYGSGYVFNRLLNISSSCGFLAWFGIAVSHYYFRKYHIKDLSLLKYKAIFFPYGTIFSMALIIIIIAGQIYTLDGTSFLINILDSYGALIIFIFLMLYYKFIKSKKLTTF